jgi:hypothetical protein
MPLYMVVLNRINKQNDFPTAITFLEGDPSFALAHTVGSFAFVER